jgi:hypothetical protein
MESATEALTVTCEVRDNGVDDWWELIFGFAAPSGAWSFKFTVEEPYLFTQAEWRALAEGGGDMSFYMGNGEGSLRTEPPDGPPERVIFVSAPSGAGGDTRAQFEAPWPAVAQALRSALAAAKDLRYASGSRA